MNRCIGRFIGSVHNGIPNNLLQRWDGIKFCPLFDYAGCEINSDAIVGVQFSRPADEVGLELHRVFLRCQEYHPLSHCHQF